jgi:tetratricopeptide (TPR) repeat protein
LGIGLGLAAPLAGADGFDYAVDLHRRGEHYRAISEFDRWLYFSPDARAPLARRHIAAAYFQGRRWNAAAEAWSRSLAESPTDEAAYFLAESLYELKRLDEAVELYGALAGGSEGFAAPARLRLLSIRLARHEWEGARAQLRAGLDAAQAPLERERWRDWGRRLDQGLDAWSPPPGAALLASALVPGAGQAWAGYPRDGLSALGLVAGFGLWAWVSHQTRNEALTWGFAGLSGVFYLGNLQGAWNAATRSRREQPRRAAQAVIQELPLDGLPEPAAP